MTILFGPIGDHESPWNDPVADTHPEISGIYRQKRGVPWQRALPELLYLYIEFSEDIRDRWLRIGGPAESLHDSADFPGCNAVYDHFRHAGNQSRFAAGIILKNKCFKRDVPVPWNRESDLSDSGFKLALPCSIPTICTILWTFIRLCFKLRVDSVIRMLLKLSFSSVRNAWSWLSESSCSISSWFNVILSWAIVFNLQGIMLILVDFHYT